MSVIGICSGKGSPGATFVAVNLAAAMSRAGDEVLLLDLDRSGGDITAYLGLDPRRGLYPLLRMNGGVSQPDQLLREAEMRHGFLCIGGFPEDAAVDSTTLVHALKIAKGSGKAVIADLGRVDQQSTALAREVDLLVVVVRPDLVSVLGAERAMRILRTACEPKRLRAIVTEVERKRPGDIKEVADAIHTPALGSIRLDRRAARWTVVSQAPIQKGRLARTFASLATTARTQVLGTESQPAEAVNA